MIIRDISANTQCVQSEGELFGLEIEVENVTIPADYTETRWEVIEDGSLRGSGQEFVSRPSTYEQCTELITKFYQWNSQYNYESNVRTSTHVHVNVLDFTTEEVGAALTTYAIVEPLLFRVCGKQREENIYCVPWYRGVQETEVVRKIVEGSMRYVSNTCKYSALYLEPLDRFGTVEFRQAPVFPDADAMMLWLDLVRAVVYDGKLFETGEEVLTQFDLLGADAFMDKLFGAELSARLKTYCDKSYEDIIDEAASVFVAELCVPSSYTYKVASDWMQGSVIEGDGQEGYHRVSVPSSQPEYSLGDEDHDGFEPDEEYYENEDEF